MIPLVDRALCREGHRLTPENRRKGRHAGECLVCHRIQRSRKRFDEAARIWINIISKDPCSYCGADGGSTDHIVATKLGGTDDWTNLTGACFRCNASKQAGSVLHFMLRRLDAA